MDLGSSFQQVVNHFPERPIWNELGRFIEVTERQRGDIPATLLRDYPVFSFVSGLKSYRSIEKWAPGVVVDINASDGFEALVTQGSFDECSETFTEQSWLRLPKGMSSKAVADNYRATVWIKRDHLAETPKAPAV